MKLTDIITEAVYPNNLGAMEVFQFYREATPQEKEQFDNYLSTNNYQDAWNIVQKVTNVELEPMGDKKE